MVGGVARDPQHILCRIVVHFAVRFDVVVQLHDARFFRRQRRAKFLQSPGEVVAVIVERVVRVLAGIKAAVHLIGKHFVDPADDALCCFAKQWIQSDLPAVQIVPQELGIVVAHFLEMRNQPALVDRIAMKTAGELVVDAAPRHFFERGFRDRKQVLFFSASGGGLLVALQNQIDGRGVRKLRRIAEATVLDVELLCDRANLRIDYAGIKVRSRAGEDFGLRDGIGDGVGGAFEVGALVLIGIGDGEEHAAKTWPPHLIFGREIGAAEERLPIR